MSSLTAATLAVAGVGLALTHDVLHARTVDPAERGSGFGDLLPVAAGWAAVALSLVLRPRPSAPPAEHEHALIWAMHTHVADRLDTYQEDRNEH